MLDLASQRLRGTVVTRRPRIARSSTKALQLGEWLQQPSSLATRREVYAVAKLIATTAINLHEAQKREFRWYRRLWSALQRLFAPAAITEDITEAVVGEAEPADTGDDPRPAELLKPGSTQEVPQADGSAVKVTDRRAGR
jgi:hypothetical protein